MVGRPGSQDSLATVAELARSLPLPPPPRPLGDSWPESYGGGAGRADSYCLVSVVLGERASRRVPLTSSRGTPSPGLTRTCAPRGAARALRAERTGDARPGGLRAWRANARGIGAPSGEGCFLTLEGKREERV